MTEPDDGDLSATVLEALFTQAPIGLYVFDEQLRVVRYNTAARGVRGLPGNAVLGRGIDEVAEGFHDPELPALCRQVLAGEGQIRDRLIRGHPRADPEREMVVSVSAFRVHLGDGPVLGVAVVQDITARQRAADRLDILHDAHRSIGTSLDMGVTADALGEVVLGRFADAVTVDVLDDALRGAAVSPGSVDADAPLRRLASRSSHDNARQTPAGELTTFPFPTPFTQSLQDASPRLVSHLAPDTPWLATAPERARHLTEAGVHSFLVTPLVVRDTVLGLVSYYRSRDPRPYDDADLALAEQLSQHTALSIDNALSYARERAIATTLQRRLLPGTPPRLSTVDTAALHLPGAESGGGTWYDVIPLSGSRVALTVGTVNGSGIEVVAAMGQVRMALATLAVQDLAPEELLGRLDDALTALSRNTGEPVTASCLYAVSDPVTRTCIAAGAGHSAPVIVGPLGEPIIMEPQVGPLLGTGRGGYEAARVDLPDGSLLALFTNGLIRSAPNSTDRLHRVLGQLDHSLHQLADETVYAFMRGRNEDDAVLLLARTRGLDENHLAEWTLPGDPAVVGTARRLAEHQLSAWALDDLSFTTELIVSELVTNAIRYGRPPIRLRMIRDRSLLCEVSDASSTAPHLRHARAHDEGGRGLDIVAQLAARWGTRFGRQGKTIWCEQELVGGQ
ncbi:SpoIIE family protein phosphatase [Streptomyces sp. NPDC050534]|uniref:ATP-binding SpoIIE family protein phosphatase n=1 Tax=Streptomyces sp. NPDC050534 TaxID=3365625 RepID=UPI0037BCBA71